MQNFINFKRFHILIMNLYKYINRYLLNEDLIIINSNYPGERIIMQKKYDVAIIGCGVVGAAIARELAHYKINTVVIEKEADVSFGASKANSGIIHGGFHAPHTAL